MLALAFLLFAVALAGPALGAGKGPAKSKRPFDVRELLAGNYTILTWEGLKAPEGIPLTGQLVLGEGEENMTASGTLERVRVTQVPVAEEANGTKGANATEEVREVLHSVALKAIVHNTTSLSLEKGGQPFCDMNFEVDEAKGRYMASGKTAQGQDFVFFIHSGLSFTLVVRDAQAGAVLYEISKARQVQPQSMKSRIFSSLMMMVPMLLSQWMMRKQMATMNQQPQPAPEGTDVPVGGHPQEGSDSAAPAGSNGANGAGGSNGHNEASNAADTAGEERE